MIGLGGGSTRHLITSITTRTSWSKRSSSTGRGHGRAKIFWRDETPEHKIYQNDGRVFLRAPPTPMTPSFWTPTPRPLQIVLPPHLTTRRSSSRCANERLTTNGFVAYNIIGQLSGWRADIIGALYRTMKEVFPQMCLFPARQSQNVVLIGTKSAERFGSRRIQEQGAALVRLGTSRLPNFLLRLRSFVNTPPPSAARSPVLTDDRARVENLLR